MAIRVFVSHRQSDSDLAAQVAVQIRRNGLETYVDVIDDALIKDGPQLSDHLLARMDQCHQLLAVVSNTTKNSWWVPWEIGVGSEKGFRMASYSREFVDLPSYLEKWPTLHSTGDIATYCRLSKKADAELRQREGTVVTEASRIRIRKSEALDFHTRLRAQLGR